MTSPKRPNKAVSYVPSDIPEKYSFFTMGGVIFSMIGVTTRNPLFCWCGVIFSLHSFVTRDFTGDKPDTDWLTGLLMGVVGLLFLYFTNRGQAPFPPRGS
ncbi:hypothetical protein BLNAU_5957 [Blattamonas nauphoetae]|uniref:Uncharacterized protein n=1 Tax=Blattamonas nauphoetae TaxID=2049346 RepID=A0ABQ9Y5Y7_9EUKA|nr:hypothetical protein BLNAU_5957 [Blattamonas nauphoetae]